MEQDSELCTVVVLESSRCLKAELLHEDTVLTLLALISEDPSCWQEALSCWPRYRTPAVCEFTSSLPFEETAREDIVADLSTAEAWAAIDFETKRIFTGGQFQEVGCDAAFAMDVDEESGKQHSPLSIHLPPWWELHEHVVASQVKHPRQSPINRPSVNREVLFGEPFLSAIATKILETFKSEAWQQSAANDKQHPYALTIAVHRDWLLTPRDDLKGRMPREQLHGAMEWNDRVTWGQQLRLQDGGTAVAAPDDWSGFATNPMGSQEMCIYFDLCREVIDAGWFWCASEEGIEARRMGQLAVNQLTEFLRSVKDSWLSISFEGGSSPSFIIECDRRRVPRGEGVAIEGIAGVESEQHIADCDCPICQMMADGMFGVGFTSIDGHHLELDDEFAFSKCETLEEWEEQQMDYAGFSESVECGITEREADEASEQENPFASAWSGISDGPIPGDHRGFVKMAFMIGEMVSELQSLDASHDEIKALNEAFADYRRANDGLSHQHASKLKQVLQSLGDLHPELISKAADLQSRIDEASRAVAHDDDMPF